MISEATRKYLIGSVGPSIDIASVYPEVIGSIAMKYSGRSRSAWPEMSQNRTVAITTDAAPDKANLALPHLASQTNERNAMPADGTMQLPLTNGSRPSGKKIRVASRIRFDLTLVFCRSASRTLNVQIPVSKGYDNSNASRNEITPARTTMNPIRIGHCFGLRNRVAANQ